MTKQDFFNRVAEICGQRLIWTMWSNCYHREMPINRPIVMKAMKDEWTYNDDIQFEPETEPYMPEQPEWYYASIYQKSKDMWLIITYSDNKYYLQENHDDGEISYYVDGSKTLAKCLRVLAKLIA